MDVPSLDLTLASARARAAQQLPASARLAGVPGTDVDATALEFESVYLNTMLQSMFAGLDEDAGTWGGGTGSDAWRGMLVEQYADTIARSGGIGISDSIKRELLALQEGAAR